MKLLRRLFLLGLITLFLLVIAEVILSFFQLFPNDYYTNTPNSSFVWEINPNEIIGIEGNSNVVFDELGARSTSNYKDKKYRIAVFGGSTTACFALTQEKTWSALLEKELGDLYWVGNFGRPGNSSNHNVLQLKYLLERPALKETKAVLIMQGINDFVSFLISSERYLNSSEDALKRFAFQHIPDNYLPFYKRLTLYKLISKAKKNLFFYLMYKDHLTKAVVDIKELKKESKIIGNLPDLTLGLNHYEKNIKVLIKQAKKKNINLIFVTQATMWKPNLEPKYEDLIITSGFANNEAFYSTEALYTGMQLFNERLKKVCEQQKVKCIDLKLPKTTESFYDDFHFNESGAKLTAKAIYTELKDSL